MEYTEIDQFFQQLALDYDATQNAWQHILSAMDAALYGKDYDALLELIPYIEEGDGYPALQNIGKTHRLLLLLKIITLEKKYRKTLFCQDCSSTDTLYEKYMLTLFAFRRIIFRLSEQSLKEAVTYLQSRPISHFAVYMIIQDELIIPDERLYHTLMHIYTQAWDDADAQQFLCLVNSLPSDG